MTPTEATAIVYMNSFSEVGRKDSFIVPQYLFDQYFLENGAMKTGFVRIELQGRTYDINTSNISYIMYIDKG